MMRRRARRRWLAAVAAVAAVTPLVTDTATAATSPGRFTATQLTPDSRYTAAKSVTGRRAQSDPDLLARTDDAPVSVGVKLDYDAAASYAGDIAGLPATSPRVTGRKLSGGSDAERRYDEYASKIEKGFTDELAAEVAGAKVTRSLRTVYGGVIVTLPASKARTLLSMKGVAAVQADTLNQLQTDSSNAFIGSPTIWAQEGGQSLAGQGVIFADLDSGIWPEHPMLADNPALGTPPPAPSGKPRACNYGDNPLTAAVDVFTCNSKVIGGQPFLNTYNTIVGGEVYGTSARDSDGHGTHTTTTAAGNAVASATVFGVERGPVSGVAPGAWVIEYKVCGLQGCFSSDSAAAVQQAIADGADVINFSISGGSNPYADIVELAFLDAYDAGIFVAASAGNSGPGAGTTDHRGPWTTTVAASTQTRAFQSTLTVTDGAASATFVGSSITAGVKTPTAIVLAKDVAAIGELCNFDASKATDATKAAVVGKVVACRRGGIGRVQKGFNLSGVGAAGMILYNQPLQDTETDNHFLPTVHLADGTAFLAFMAAHPAATATFTDAVKGTDKGDVMAAFSSRGPGGQFLKPDITAPGVQILAGNTPTPDAVPAGPAGQYYQAIAGTSMSGPHVAGSAILLKALRPEWTPGAIKSALMTTAKTSVVKEDLTTPADPFDMGAGRVDLTVAGAARLVFDESAANMLAKGQDPVTAVQLNLPSINAPTMPGTITVTRTATNTTGRDVEFRASATAPAGARITISPSEGTVRRGRSVTFTIRITSSAPTGQYFGQVDIDTGKGSPKLHLPVAFFNKQGDVTLTSACNPTSITEKQTSTCTITATNGSFSDANVRLATTVSDKLRLVGATGATLSRNRSAGVGPIVLPGAKDGTPTLAPTTPDDTPGGGFFDLQDFGINPVTIGDEDIINLTVPAFSFTGRTYTRIGITSNGYAVVGGGDAGDVDFVAATFPDTNPPNNVLAPYWSDLEGAGTEGVRAGVLTDGTNSWIVLQWDVRVWGLPSEPRSFQAWIRTGTTATSEDITFSYAANALGKLAPGADLSVGTENASGTGGNGLGLNVAPASDYRITSTGPVPGGSVSYTVDVTGNDRGTGSVTTAMDADIVPGTTVVSTRVTVTRSR